MNSREFLARRYQQLLSRCPLQTDLVGGQHWSWIDTGSIPAANGSMSAASSNAETLLLLPGFMGEAGTSFLYVEALMAQTRVISVSFPPEIGQVQALCDGLAALLEHLGLAQAVVLGGSSSGFLAQAFVRRHPARCSALILTHTGLPSAARARTARAGLRLLRLVPFGLLRRILQLWVYTYFPCPTPGHVFWRAHFQQVIACQTAQAMRSRFALMEDFHSHSHFEPGDLSNWPGQLLLMEMRRDQLTTPDEQVAMRKLYPGARLHVFADTAHYDSVERPAEQIAVIADFLRNRQG